MTPRWLVIALLALGVPVWASETPPPGTAVVTDPLDLDELIAAVLADSPPLDVLAARVEVSRGALLAARGGFDPVLSARGSAQAGGYYEYLTADASLTVPTAAWGASFFGGWRLGRALSEPGIPDYYGGYDTLDGGELRAGLVLPLLRDGAIDARRASLLRAELGVEASEAELAARRLRLVAAATEAWARWVAAGRKLLVAEQVLDLALTRDAQLAARVAAGAIAAVEHLENQRAVAERRVAVVQAQRAVERASIALSLYYRRAGAPVLPPRDRLPPPDEVAPVLADEAAEVAAALAQRPELLRLDAALESAEVALRAARNTILPRLDLTLGVNADVGSDPDPYVVKSLQPVNATGSLSVSLPVVVREGRGRAAAAEAELDALRAERRLAGDQVTAEVRDARSAVDTAARALSLAEASADIAEAVARAERVRFEEGLGTMMLVNLRETAAAQARVAVADARAELVVGAALWRAVTARGDGSP